MEVPPRYRYRWRWLALALIGLTLVLILSSAAVLWNVERHLDQASSDPSQLVIAQKQLAGTWRWLLIAQAALLIPFILGIWWFVQLQKREFEKLTATERSLRENEEIFQHITEHMSDFLAILDPQGRRIYNSASYSSLLGPPDKLKNTDSFMDVHPDDRERVKDVFRRTVETKQGELIQYRMLASNGSIAIIESQGNVILDSNGNVAKVIVVSRDITERDRAYQRLQRQNATLSSLSHSPSLIGPSLETAFQRITEAAANTLEVERVGIWLFSENLGSLRASDIFVRSRNNHLEKVEISSSKYPKYFAALAEGRCIAANNVEHDERTMEFTEEYSKPLGITSMLDAPIRRGGQLVGVICHEHIGPARAWTPDEEAFASSLGDLLAISLEFWEHRRTARALREAHDTLEAKVTERTRELAEANERLQELDRLKSQFLSTMSHELRTPLNSIIGFTGILRQGMAGPLNEEQNKQLGMVHSSAKHLLGLITDLLDVCRLESGRLELGVERFTLESVVHEVVESFTGKVTAKNLKLVAALDDPALAIDGDRKRVHQVLNNLVGNAVKFTEHGQILITSRAHPETLEITVSDTGIGIRPEQMENLFVAFRQVDGSARRVYQGTGLGLYLSRQLLTLMGGDIRVHSTFGEGTTFTFTIPRHLQVNESAA